MSAYWMWLDVCVGLTETGFSVSSCSLATWERRVCIWGALIRYAVDLSGLRERLDL